jgi:preprotein translocase subunit SecB
LRWFNQNLTSTGAYYKECYAYSDGSLKMDEKNSWGLDDFGAATATDGNGTTGQPATPADQPAMSFRGQYVKNISYNGPGLTKKIEGQPKTALNYNINVQEVEPHVHEFLFGVTAEISDDKDKFLIINVNYGVLYQLTNIPAEHQERILVTEGGRFVFPYVQRLVADIMREGGVPGFQLPQIDFYKAYQQMKEAK